MFDDAEKIFNRHRREIDRQTVHLLDLDGSVGDVRRALFDLAKTLENTANGVVEFGGFENEPHKARVKLIMTRKIKETNAEVRARMEAGVTEAARAELLKSKDLITILGI